jgi:hypothetical protein
LPRLSPAIATLGVLALLAPAAAHASGVAITPAPGTPDAAPQTQLSILGVAPGRIVSVRLVGSVTGAHAGRLHPYAHGRGASFVPTKPFEQGERVSARVRLRGRSAITWSFTVARLDATPPLLTIKSHQPDKLDHFVSQPDLLAPRITVLHGGGAGHGSIFLTPLPSPVVHPGSNNAVSLSPVGPGGPMIVDGQGQLVWFKQLAPPDVAANLQIQRYAGHRVLTWWQGPVTTAAYGLGEGVIADGSYRTIRTVHAGNGYAMDIHDFVLTPAGDALFTINSRVLVHVPGTPAATLTSVLDAIVQEVDVRTGLVVWEWHALGHIPLAESQATPQNSAYYDAFHINSIQALSGRRILISARDTSAIYEVDQVHGRILWTLGGTSSDFRFGPGARFWFQHDARLLPGDRVSLFDDEAGPPQKAPSSRGLVLALDRRRHRATVVRAVKRPGQTSAQSEGSLQTLAGGNLFAGFGAEPFFSEFSSTGHLVFDARLPQDDGSYRAFRYRWTATPRTVPVAGVTRTGPSAVTAYASWNGATKVARWQVLAGPDAGSLHVVASRARRGFETAVPVTGSATTFAVRALGAHGQTLATSAPVTAG